MTFEEALRIAASRGLSLERVSLPDPGGSHPSAGMFYASLRRDGASPAEASAAKWNPKLWGLGRTAPEAIVDAVDRWHDAETRAWAPFVAAAEAALQARI